VDQKNYDMANKKISAT